MPLMQGLFSPLSVFIRSLADEASIDVGDRYAKHRVSNEKYRNETPIFGTGIRNDLERPPGGCQERGRESSLLGSDKHVSRSLYASSYSIYNIAVILRRAIFIGHTVWWPIKLFTLSITAVTSIS